MYRAKCFARRRRCTQLHEESLGRRGSPKLNTQLVNSLCNGYIFPGFATESEFRADEYCTNELDDTLATRKRPPHLERDVRRYR
jgi:hypothetical protein